jgi:phosphoribosylformylglycinamidine synthase subunit PurS
VGILAVAGAIIPDEPSNREFPVPRVVVDVMPKPEILDPQGQAIMGALGRLGVDGVVGVRQGKHFELDLDDALDADAVQERATRIAETLLANPVIEDFTVRTETE